MGDGGGGLCSASHHSMASIMTLPWASWATRGHIPPPGTLGRQALDEVGTGGQRRCGLWDSTDSGLNSGPGIGKSHKLSSFFIF